MIPVSTLYDEYIERRKFTEQKKKNPVEYIVPPPSRGSEQLFNTELEERWGLPLILEPAIGNCRTDRIYHAKKAQNWTTKNINWQIDKTQYGFNWRSYYHLS